MGYEVPKRREYHEEEDVYAKASPRKIVPGHVLEVPANSGGAVLSNGAILSVSIKALARNSGDIYVGSDDAPPYSGFGFCLEPGEAWSVDVALLQNVRLVAVISGDKVTWAGLQ